MSIAAPLFLLAAAAGAIPVLLHMIHNQRAVQVHFSTLRFLRLSVERTRRRKRLEDVSLLVLRVAALFLIALALSRPALTSLKTWFGRGTTAVVIILDNSTSMGVADEGNVRFESARRAAETIVDGYRDGDALALLLTGGPPGPELGKLVTAHETVRQALAQAHVSYERADLAARLQQARSLLDQAETANRLIYVLTDNQALSWKGLPPGADDTGSAHEPPVILVNFNRNPAPNVALRNLRLECPALTVGVPIQVSVEVLNAAAVPQQKTLELFVDSAREAVSPTLNLPPGSVARYEFQFRVERGGVHRGEVRLAEEDGCPQDNRLFFALVVDQRIPVAVIKARQHEIAYVEDSFYLERALNPAGLDGWAVQVTTLTPEKLASEPLGRYAVVFCVNLPAFDREPAERLRDYASGGGHVVWICGDNVWPAAYNRMNGFVHGALLPAPFMEGKEQATTTASGWRVGSLDKDHPALGPLTEPASLYQSVLVHKLFPLATPLPIGTRVLARLNDNQPLLVERPVGSGSVVVLATGAHIVWTNLPLKPLFLPLVARLTFHWAGTEADRSQVLAGTPLVVPGAGAAAGTEMEVVRPTGEKLRVPLPEDKTQPFRYTDTHDVGVYVLQMGDPKFPRQYAFAVNPDPEEADPAVLPISELKTHFGKRPLVVCEGPEELPAIMHRLQEGESLQEIFLAAVLFSLVCEAFLANRIAAGTAGKAIHSSQVQARTPNSVEDNLAKAQ